MYGYRQSKIYSNSSGYAPSAQKLFVYIKDIIERTFPRLNQYIIDDALTYGIHQYTEYLLTDASKVDSDEVTLDAEEFFLSLVMERILEHNIRQHDTLIAFMLAHQRHNTQTPLTVNQAFNQSFSSDLLTLPFPPGQLQKMVEPILEEKRQVYMGREIDGQLDRAATRREKRLREEEDATRRLVEYDARLNAERQANEDQRLYFGRDEY
jgi:hypothetical protein